MTDNLDGRMLLSHNFALTEGEVHPLNREEFADVFTKGLADKSAVSCNPIESPHWVVEVHYQTSELTPEAVGQLCAETLGAYRKAHRKSNFCVMALGGEKTTPPTGEPPSLQTGEWGVDVVETAAPEEFLEEINWDKLAGAKPAEKIFRVDYPV